MLSGRTIRPLFVEKKVDFIVSNYFCVITRDMYILHNIVFEENNITYDVI